jgi:hypothetical protein
MAESNIAGREYLLPCSGEFSLPVQEESFGICNHSRKQPLFPAPSARMHLELALSDEQSKIFSSFVSHRCANSERLSSMGRRMPSNSRGLLGPTARRAFDSKGARIEFRKDCNFLFVEIVSDSRACSNNGRMVVSTHPLWCQL